MDVTIGALVVAAVTLAFNISMHVFGGGWKLSQKLASLETSVLTIQADLKELAQVLINMADIRGEIKVMDTRVSAIEQDIRELRHGEGFVKRQFPLS